MAARKRTADDVQGSAAADVVSVTSPRARSSNWSEPEVLLLISVRAEDGINKKFRMQKRNKDLWQEVSARLAARGYQRSPDNCATKWKSMLNELKVFCSSSPPGGG
jgi:hypothetical protein